MVSKSTARASQRSRSAATPDRTLDAGSSASGAATSAAAASAAATPADAAPPEPDDAPDAVAGAATEPLRARAVALEDLLRRYRLHGGSGLLDQIVERCRGAVEAMAFTMASRLPRSVDAQDLVHAGIWGLMQAIAAFEPDRCDRFQPFMRIRVRGAMLDELRHMDFLPRLFRRRVRERDAARARLRMELEREPTLSELAAALGTSEVALLRCPEAAALRTGLSADGDGSDDADGFDQLADDACASPIEAITQKELLELVRQSLQPIEWQVLQLHYLEGLTGRQVARRLRLSASRICQIHVQVLDRLKQRLTATAV